MAKKKATRKKTTKPTTEPADVPVIPELAPPDDKERGVGEGRSKPGLTDVPDPEPADGEQTGSEGEASGPGFPHDYEPADWIPIQCPRCGSTDREPFKGRTRRVGPMGRRYHHMLKWFYTTVVFRPTRCKNCGQRIMSREYIDESRVGDSDTAD